MSELGPLPSASSPQLTLSVPRTTTRLSCLLRWSPCSRWLRTFYSPSLNAGMTLETPSDQAGAGAATTASGSVPENSPSHPSGRTLPDICHTLRRKLDAFLDEQTEDEVLRNVQSQARVSMGVISEALQRYGWVPPPSTSRCYACKKHNWCADDTG
jgi:hypothetical protein